MTLPSCLRLDITEGGRKEGHQCDQYIGSMLALHPLLSAVSQRIIAALIRAALDHDTNRLEMHERYNFEILNSSYSG